MIKIVVDMVACTEWFEGVQDNPNKSSMSEILDIALEDIRNKFKDAPDADIERWLTDQVYDFGTMRDLDYDDCEQCGHHPELWEWELETEEKE